MESNGSPVEDGSPGGERCDCFCHEHTDGGRTWVWDEKRWCCECPPCGRPVGSGLTCVLEAGHEEDCYNPDDVAEFVQHDLEVGLPGFESADVPEARTCVYVPADQYVEGKGWVPSVVTEGEPGHSPLTGQGELSEPWFWGHDYVKACGIADDYNRRLGLTPEDVEAIVVSSVAASLRADGARRELDRKLGRDRDR